jgi:RNA ligase
MDLALIEKMVEEGFVTKNVTDCGKYALYNYNKDCQFQAVWNEATIACRGLIIHIETGSICARPFPKFFNWEELPGLGIEVPKEKFSYAPKMDGSLGILWNARFEEKHHRYCDMDNWNFATRGSFNSDQALEASEILVEEYLLKDNYDEVELNLNVNYTYLFEIIYPENRIVLDYGNERELVLLAVIDNETGNDVDEEFYRLSKVFPIADYESKPVSFESLKALDLENEEGYVLRFESGFRMKIKFEEYVRLHRLVTNITHRRLWKMLSEGEDLSELKENVPEEFEKYILDYQAEVFAQMSDVKSTTRALLKEITKYNFKTQKEKALMVNDVCVDEYADYKGLVFHLMNRGEHNMGAIWKRIYPDAE